MSNCKELSSIQRWLSDAGVLDADVFRDEQSHPWVTSVRYALGAYYADANALSA